jgi:hypothetical protein
MLDLKKCYEIAMRRNAQKMEDIKKQYPDNYSYLQQWRKLMHFNSVFSSIISGTYRKNRED